MTRYSGFAELEKLTALTKTERGYSKFIQTGDTSVYDYNRGFIDVQVYAYRNHKKDVFVRIYFGTIDDGDFGAWKECQSLLEANELVERIAHEVFKNMVKLPSDDELNKLLARYGVYVCHE